LSQAEGNLIVPAKDGDPVVTVSFRFFTLQSRKGNSVYPQAIKLEHAKDMVLLIDGDDGPGKLSITVELESAAGTGQPQLTLKRGDREIIRFMNANQAETLADALRLFASARERINKDCRKPEQALAPDMGEWARHWRRKIQEAAP
jgi:hypothetical protein